MSIKQMLAKYNTNSKDKADNAVREICQEIILSGLCDGKFFERAVFYGGTCLRILYDLQRYSEDLDFSLLQKDENFNIERYFEFIVKEFNAYNVKIETKRKQKNENSSVESALISINANQFLNSDKIIKIKIDVDKNPPLNFQAENKILLMPKSFILKAMTLPNLYAGKIHAILFRAWKMRVKGRDWFDLEWYVKNDISLNLEHLLCRMRHFGDTDKNYITRENLEALLLAKIDEIDIQKAIDDVKRFIINPKELEIWDKDYFKFLISKMRYQQEQVLLESTEKITTKRRKNARI